MQRFLVQIRGHDRPPAPPRIPAARHITAWIMRPDDKLTDDDRLGLKDARCTDLDVLTELAHGFNRLVRERRGHQLEEWIKKATARLVLRPEIAALSMSGSSLIVAVNALALKRLHLPIPEPAATQTPDQTGTSSLSPAEQRT